MTKTNHSLQIKTVSCHEVHQVAAFISDHSIPNCISTGMLLHQLSGILVAIDTVSNQMVGVSFSISSLLMYKTAYLECLVINTQHRRKGIGSWLLHQTSLHWANKCIHHITVPYFAHNDAVLSWQKSCFQRLCKTAEGLKYWLYTNLPDRICMQNRILQPTINTSNGEVSEDTVFEYRQKGTVVWATFSGGPVAMGVLIGKMVDNGDIEFYHQQIDLQGKLSTGKSKSSTEFQKDGRLVLYENWEWTGGRKGSGTAIIAEIEGFPHVDAE